MATSWSKASDISFGAADLICRRVQEMTNGHFVIAPYAADELAPSLKVLDVVQTAEVECGHTNSIYYIDKNPALAFGSSVPFGLNPQQQNSWLLYGGGLTALQKIYTEFNVMNFPAGNTGAQMGGWFKQEINSVADLKGLKMRIPGWGGRVMKELGVEVKVMATMDILTALASGEIDAAEWICPYEDEKLGFNQVAQYYYYPGWWETGPTLNLYVNKTAWDKLSKEYQAILETAALEANFLVITQYNAVNGKALKRLEQGGTQFRQYSDEILLEAQKIAFDLYAAEAAKNASFQEMFMGWQKFRSQIQHWHRFNEVSFGDFAFSYQG
jgi:TRAP-type mannitol/chloroaromatic compound transport system substrate-binding protein